MVCFPYAPAALPLIFISKDTGNGVSEPISKRWRGQISRQSKPIHISEFGGMMQAIWKTYMQEKWE
jgi:hypothetical protein